MPEGPEVKLTVDFLNETLKDQKIKKWIFVKGKYTETTPDGFEEFNKSLPLIVKEINCKGKFIYFILVDSKGEKYYILHNLMMSGTWQKKQDSSCKWYIETQENKLWFQDIYSFATIKFTKDEDVIKTKLNNLGPDILGEHMSLKLFKEILSKYPGKNITALLMDQSIICGCGNYIKAECLYYSGINPTRKTSSLKDREQELLYEAIKVIPRISYNRKGISRGNYSKYLKIYGKKQATKTKTPDGRITYWDPDIQK